MNCPNCNTDLIPGDAFFKKSLTNFALFGFGSKDLVMTTNAGDDIFLLAASERASGSTGPRQKDRAFRYKEESGTSTI